MMLLIFLHYIFGFYFPEAIIRVRDFFIHTIKFSKLNNQDFLQHCYRYTVKINEKLETGQSFFAQ